MTKRTAWIVVCIPIAAFFLYILSSLIVTFLESQVGDGYSIGIGMAPSTITLFSAYILIATIFLSIVYLKKG